MKLSWPQKNPEIKALLIQLGYVMLIVALVIAINAQPPDLPQAPTVNIRKGIALAGKVPNGIHINGVYADDGNFVLITLQHGYMIAYDMSLATSYPLYLPNGGVCVTNGEIVVRVAKEAHIFAIDGEWIKTLNNEDNDFDFTRHLTAQNGHSSIAVEKGLLYERVKLTTGSMTNILLKQYCPKINISRIARVALYITVGSYLILAGVFYVKNLDATLDVYGNVLRRKK